MQFTTVASNAGAIPGVTLIGGSIVIANDEAKSLLIHLQRSWPIDAAAAPTTAGNLASFGWCSRTLWHRWVAQASD